MNINIVINVNLFFTERDSADSISTSNDEPQVYSDDESNDVESESPCRKSQFSKRQKKSQSSKSHNKSSKRKKSTSKKEKSVAKKSPGRPRIHPVKIKPSNKRILKFNYKKFQDIEHTHRIEKYAAIHNNAEGMKQIY